jgi:hypothetical protein
VISGEETFPAGGSVLALAGSANRDLPGVDHTLTLTRALSRYPVGASASRIVPPADDPYSALLTDPGPYDFLLVASHMRSAERPERTAVRLPRPDPDHPGEYLAFDISSLELLNGVRPHIRRAVILAGCSSAQAAGGSDLVSLAAVLLHASGAPAVLAAHLPVSDFWATLLWAELFERLRTGRSLAAALAEAQAVLAEVRADSWPRYLAALRERFPDPACSVFLDWAAARLAEAASRITAGSLMPLPDRAAWTILERT